MASITAITAANNAIQAGNNVLSTGGESNIIALLFVLGIVVSVSVIGFVLMVD